MNLGSFQVDCIVENRCYLDGGSMFGVVPKKIWSALVESTPENLIPMDTNIFVIRDGHHTLVVDCGLGDLLTEKERKLYGCFTPSQMDAGLARLGIRVDDITHVVLTHLHLDHVGGAVGRGSDGQTVPRFPNAQYVVQHVEWEAASDPDERSAAAYSPEKFIPLREHRRLRLVEGEAEVFPGVRVVLTGGHTAGHQGVIVESRGERLYLFADIVPLSAHLRPAYVAAADLYPMETIAVKKELMGELVAHGWYLGFDHDIDIKLARIGDTGLKLVARKVDL